MDFLERPALHCAFCGVFVSREPRNVPGDELCTAHAFLWACSDEGAKYHTVVHSGRAEAEQWFQQWLKKMGERT